MQGINIEYLVNKLKEIGFSRAKLVKSEINCYILITEVLDEQFLISVRRGTISNKLIAKIVPAYMLPYKYWSCIYLEYIPQGLYAFAENEDTLTDQILRKCKRIIKILKRS